MRVKEGGVGEQGEREEGGFDAMQTDCKTHFVLQWAAAARPIAT